MEGPTPLLGKCLTISLSPQRKDRKKGLYFLLSNFVNFCFNYCNNASDAFFVKLVVNGGKIEV